MTPEDFSLLQRGDRVAFLKQPTTSIIVDRDETTLTIENDSFHWGLSNTISVEDADDLVFMAPLSAYYPGAEFTAPDKAYDFGGSFEILRSENPPRVTVTEVTVEGIYYHVEGDVHHFYDQTDDEGMGFFPWVKNGSSQGVQERLSKIFAADLRTVQRTQHPVHGHDSPRPNLESLTVGQRFHDGVHRSPKFFTVLFVADDYVLAEDDYSLEIQEFNPEQLENMFQSLQVAQVEPGITIYRSRGMAICDITQVVDRIEDGKIHYTEDSVIKYPDLLLNPMCSFEQRKMYFAV